MRILLAYKRAPWIERHIVTSFRALNQQLDCLDLRVGVDARPTESSANWTRPPTFPAEGYDLIFMVEASDDIVDLEALSRARRNGTIICNYLADVPQDWWRSLDVSRVCSVVLVAQKENATRLKRATNEIIYFPFAVSEEFLCATSLDSQDGSSLEERPKSAVFIGSAHSRWRWRFLSELDKAEVPFDVVGDGWLGKSSEHKDVRYIGTLLKRYSAGHHLQRLCGSGGPSAVIGGLVNTLARMPRTTFKNARFHNFLDETALGILLRQAAVNVSTSVHGSGYLVGRPKRQFKLRDIEFPCFAVPFLTNPAPELKEIFEPGKQVLFYDSWQELIALTRNACQFPSQYRNLSIAARTLIKRNHTWTSRFRDLSNIINLNLSIP
jgi:hypothetical protein